MLEESARLIHRDWSSHFSQFPASAMKTTSMGDEEILRIAGGGTPSTRVASYWEDGEVTWVTPTDITNARSLILLDSAKKITTEGLRNSSARIVPANSVLAERLLGFWFG